MSLLSAAFLGVIEGLTEFLPISSTGHLMLASNLLQLPSTEFHKSFEIAIQLGAMLAVVILYAQRLFLDRRTITLILTAFLPTALIGLLLHDLVKRVLLESITTVLWSFFLGGIVLIVFELLHREHKTDRASLADVTYTQAFLIGLCQSIALIPGVSRSGATIVGGMLLGLKRSVIVEFSFLLAVPTIAAATALDLLKSASVFTTADMTALLIGFITSFVTAMIAIRWLLRFIQHHSFIPFGIYRIAVAIAAGAFILF